MSKYRFKTLDSVMTHEKLDPVTRQVSKSQFHKTGTEMDGVMSVVLRVPKPVLEYVLLCHQEESNWPLMEGKALKERFDDIFEASRYAKALQELQDLRKEHVDTGKDLRATAVESEGLLREATKMRADLAKDQAALAAFHDTLQRARLRRERAAARLEVLVAARDATAKLQTDATLAGREFRRAYEEAVAAREATERACTSATGQQTIAAFARALRGPSAADVVARFLGDGWEEEGAAEYLQRRLQQGKRRRVEALLEACDALLERARSALDADERTAGELRAEADALGREVAEFAEARAAGRAAREQLAHKVQLLVETLHGLAERYALGGGGVALPPRAASADAAGVMAAGGRLATAMGEQLQARTQALEAEVRAAGEAEVSAQSALDRARADLAATEGRIKAVERSADDAEREARDLEGGALRGAETLERRRRAAQERVRALKADLAAVEAAEGAQLQQTHVSEARDAVARLRARERSLFDRANALRRLSAEQAQLQALLQRAATSREAAASLVHNSTGKLDDALGAGGRRAAAAGAAAGAGYAADEKLLRALEQAVQAAQAQAEDAHRRNAQATADAVSVRARVEAAEREVEEAGQRERDALRKVPEDLVDLLESLDDVEREVARSNPYPELPDDVPPELIVAVARLVVDHSNKKHVCRVCGRGFGEDVDAEEVQGVERSMGKFVDAFSRFADSRKAHFEAVEKLRAARAAKVDVDAERAKLQRVKARRDTLRASLGDAERVAQTIERDWRACQERASAAVEVLQTLGSTLRSHLQSAQQAEDAALALRRTMGGAAEDAATTSAAAGGGTLEDVEAELAQVRGEMERAERQREQRQETLDRQRQDVDRRKRELQNAEEEERRLEQESRSIEEQRARVRLARERAQGARAALEEEQGSVASKQQRVRDASSTLEGARAAARAATDKMDKTRQHSKRDREGLSALMNDVRSLAEQAEQAVRLTRPRGGGGGAAADVDASVRLEAVREQLAAIEDRRSAERDAVDEMSTVRDLVNLGLQRVRADDASADAKARATALERQVQAAEEAAATGAGGDGAVGGDAAAAVQEEDQRDDDLIASDSSSSSGGEGGDRDPPAGTAAAAATAALEGPSLKARIGRLQVRLRELDRFEARMQGREKTHEEKVTELQRRLRHKSFEEIDRRHAENVLRSTMHAMAVDDLARYREALDAALVRYHQIKLTEINQSIRHLWELTYRGKDIESIEIASDIEQDAGTASAAAASSSSATTTTTRRSRSYNYRVVMVKDGVKLDMRGRCSAGQKVLASLVIRLALADAFCTQTGFLALDEPTTNLDHRNKDALAHAIALIVKERHVQSQFQLIIITHDNEFVDRLNVELATEGVAAHAPKYYYAITRERGRDGEGLRSHINRLAWGVPPALPAEDDAYSLVSRAKAPRARRAALGDDGDDDGED